MRIYTRTGDDGKTSIIGSGRHQKSDIRFEAIGVIDELNSYLGICTQVCHASISHDVLTVQHILFEIGTELAYEEPKFRINADDVSMLETIIDTADQKIEPLRSFILPGGSKAAAHLQYARAICRRAERSLVTYAQQSPVNQFTISYINRLSDVLFTWSRLSNKLNNVEDVKWTARG